MKNSTRTVSLIATLLLFSGISIAGFSVDDPPREIDADQGDVFLPGLVCEVDDGDGSCPVPPSLHVPIPSFFNLAGFALEPPLPVCTQPTIFPPGILFSFDDGWPGPGSTAPSFATEIFFYDRCERFGPPRSYATDRTESALGLGGNPPPADLDDDLDALETRRVLPFWSDGVNLLFTPGSPANGGLSASNIYFSNSLGSAAGLWATPASLGVPVADDCDIDGIAPLVDPDEPSQVILFTTDGLAPCGLDPGDIYVSDNAGSYTLWADDVIDLKIALREGDHTDIDALAINTEAGFEILEPYDPAEGSFFKADWLNYAPSGMPDFSQDHLAWAGPATWCGPAALANSFWWFDSELDCDRDRTSGQEIESEPNNSCNTADLLGEVPAIPGGFTSDPDQDWYVFDVPGLGRICEVTVSTCSLREPGDADTRLELYGACQNSGVPGQFIDRNDDGCLPARQSEITARVAGGRRYHVLVDQGPGGTVNAGYTLSLGIDCYPLVERFPETTFNSGTPDDHSELNPTRLIPALATCMNTNDVQSTGSGHLGTRLPDMQACIDDWLVDKGLDDRFDRQVELAPPFQRVVEQIERSDDVLLLLGFYWQNSLSEVWTRCGGHYVTGAGVDDRLDSISLSDPGLNNAEPPTGGLGRVRGPDHADHAPATNPPPDHDDAQNVAHDLYAVGPTNLGLPVARWALPSYATPGAPTTCIDVARWCAGDEWGQNPAAQLQAQVPCPSPGFRVSTEVEAMVDVSPVQSPICVLLNPDNAWPHNLRIRRGGCQGSADLTAHDMIRGKLCNLRTNDFAIGVDLGHVQCLYDDAHVNEFTDLSPDDTTCTRGSFYLVRRSNEASYGDSSASMPRVPSTGGCP